MAMTMPTARNGVADGAAMPAAPNPLQGAIGLAGGSGTLGNGQVNPLAQLFQRQLAQGPGGAGTPVQQAQGQMGGLGAPMGQLQGPVGAHMGGITVPGTTNQSPFFNASNGANAQQTGLKAAGGLGGLGGASLSGLEGSVGPAVQNAINAGGADTTYGAFNANILQSLTQAGFTPQMISAIQGKLFNAGNPGMDMQNAGGGNTAQNLSSYSGLIDNTLSGLMGGTG
jgi:hypothetical protein